MKRSIAFLAAFTVVVYSQAAAQECCLRPRPTLVVRPGEPNVRLASNLDAVESQRLLDEGALLVSCQEFELAPHGAGEIHINCKGSVKAENSKFTARAARLVVGDNGQRLTFESDGETVVRVFKRGAEEHLSAQRVVLFTTENRMQVEGATMLEVTR
jgi:hypothetical protein